MATGLGLALLIPAPVNFRPFADFFRISVLNTILCVLAVFYGYPRMLLGR